MPEFESWHIYSRFEFSTKSLSRYIRSKSDEKFLETVIATSESRHRVLPQGTDVWRSQICHDFVEIHWPSLKTPLKMPCPLSNERMKPLPDMAVEGRANPKGIPFLYLSTDKKTAMAEVRPWLGTLISLGRFKIKRDVTVVDCVDCTVQDGIDSINVLYFLSEPKKEEWEGIVWSQINNAFSKPVTPSDKVADYIPTQIIAELFKTNGFDGIAYKSSLGKGENIVLFDIEIADIEESFLYKVDDLSLSFKDAAFPSVYKETDDL